MTEDVVEEVGGSGLLLWEDDEVEPEADGLGRRDGLEAKSMGRLPDRGSTCSSSVFMIFLRLAMASCDNRGTG